MKTKEEKKELAPIDETLHNAMTVEGIVAQQSLVKDVMKKVMQEKKHFGVIPGCEKPSLWKPGAEVLCMTFRLAPSFESENSIDGQHMTVVSRCTLTHIPTGRVFGSGEALCSTKEKKYRLRKENGRIVENQSLPDSYNTVLKMANKRALVAAVLVATAASEVFTQDMEDGAEPLVVIDTEAVVKEAPKKSPKEERKPETEKETTVKKAPKEDGFICWTGLIVNVEEGELPGGIKMWTAVGANGDNRKEFKTTDPIFAEICRTHQEQKKEVLLKYAVNSKKSCVLKAVLEKEDVS